MEKLALIHKMYQSTSIETLNRKLVHVQHIKNQHNINEVHQITKEKRKEESRLGSLDPGRHKRVSISLSMSLTPSVCV